MWLYAALFLIVPSYSMEGTVSECSNDCVRIIRAKVNNTVILDGIPGRDWMRERFFGLEEGMGTRCGGKGDTCLTFDFRYTRDNTPVVAASTSHLACHDGALVLGPLGILDSGYYWQPNYFWQVPTTWTFDSYMYAMPCDAVKLIVEN
ncbi:unnamed protein product [Strongylus vulgaris]|uniref:Uncharacterized protein n=1 Tax=Strongylus vulgaris TaxID=40348 RepID=A0A3P7L6K3_STRVU|nr:unnamed protein product [Strongylus vulgaris]